MNVVELVLLNGGILAYLAAVALSFSAVRTGTPRTLFFARIASSAGALLHGGLLVWLGVGLGHFPVTNLFEFTILLAATLAVIGVGIDLLRGMPILTVGTTPLVLVFAVIAAMLGGSTEPRPEKVTTFTASMHVIVMLVSFGAFALAFVGALLYIFEQRQLKGRPSTPLLGILPSLETLYRLTMVCVGIGVALLTAGVLVGYLYARRVETGSSAWRTDPKIWLTTLTWFAYLLVAGGSMLPAFRGRKVAWASVVCFVFVILTFWATAFWSPSFHNFR
jgi:ABC-type uncharacterized transport system permease subunit